MLKKKKKRKTTEGEGMSKHLTGSVFAKLCVL